MTPLESHYKWLLQLYPAAYRAQRGDEILATLVESVEGERTWPTFGDAVDLGGHAVRLRLGIGEQQPIGRLFAIVGPCQLVMAGLMAVIGLVWGEWSPFSPWPWVPPGHFGPFFTAGPLVYFAWVLSALSLVVHRPKVTRGLAALSVALTALLVPIGHVFGLGRPPMYFLIFLVVLGIPYVAIPNQGSVWSATRPSQKVLLLLPLVAAAVIALEVARTRRYGLGPGVFFYRLALAGIVPWIAWLAAAAVVAAVVSMAMGRRVLGATIALFCLPWMTLWWGSHFASYASPRDATTGFVIIGILLLLLAKFATTVRSNALEEARSG